MSVEEHDEFKKDVKRLLKRFGSLSDDLFVVKKILMIMPGERPPFSCRIDQASSTAQLVKVRKIACKSLKGEGVNSGLRMVYAHIKKENRIVLIGLYEWNDKENENVKSILCRFD